jgi:hypothetical protein
MLGMFDLFEASEVKPNSNSFHDRVFGQAEWACSRRRSLEGETRVQQNNNWLLL